MPLPIPPAQDGLVPHTVPPALDRVSKLPVPPVPPNPVEDPILYKNHEYNWYKHKKPDKLPINRQLLSKSWVIRLPTGYFLDDSGDISNGYSPIYYFSSRF